MKPEIFYKILHIELERDMIKRVEDLKTKEREGTKKTVEVKPGSCYESSSNSYSPLTKKG